MTRGIFRFLAFSLALGTLCVAAAHHPPKMERCESVAFTGEIERIEWRMPHVELFIRTDEGVSHRVSWLSINQLALADIHRETLHVGDRVVITAGIRPDDVVDRPMLLSYVHRISDAWGWSQMPQGC